MQIGLLGKANVGKSTFFSAATETPVHVGNFPFTTIEPNIGVAYVKTDCACKHFKIEHKFDLCVGGTRFIPVKLVDVAGLVPGAHQGKGLGNQFLDDARQAQILVHVVDISGSTDLQGQPVPAGSHDPLEDIKFVEEEFDLWFKHILDREWDKLTRELDQKSSKAVEVIARRFSGLGVTDYDVHEVLQKLDLLNKKTKEWTDSDVLSFITALRKKTKPIIIAANKADLCKDLDILTKIADHKVIPCSAETELLLRKAAKSGIVDYVPGTSSFSIKEDSKISDQQRKALNLVKQVFDKIETTGIQRLLNAAVYDSLNFITAYPVEDETKLSNKDGEVLPDAKLLPKGSTAKDLARIVHEDIAKGFLHAIDCKTKQRIGADSKLKDGDVIKIVSSLSRS